MNSTNRLVMLSAAGLAALLAAGSAAASARIAAASTVPPATGDVPCAVVPAGLNLVLAGNGAITAVDGSTAEKLSAGPLEGDPVLAARGPDGTLWVQTPAGVGRVRADGSGEMVRTGTQVALSAAGWLDSEPVATIIDAADVPFNGSDEERGAVLIAPSHGEPRVFGPATGPEYGIGSATLAGDRIVASAGVDLTEAIDYFHADGKRFESWYTPTPTAEYAAPPAWGNGIAAPLPDGTWVLSWTEGPDSRSDSTVVEGDWVLAAAEVQTSKPRLRLPVASQGEMLIHADFDGRFWVGTFGRAPQTATAPSVPEQAPAPVVAERVVAVDLGSPTVAVTDLRCTAGLVATIDRNGTAQPPAGPANGPTTTTPASPTVPPPTTPRPPKTTLPKPASGACPKPLPIQPKHYPITRCHKGGGIAQVQFRLRERGYNVQVDGAFGPATEAAVRKFQKSSGLPVDGKVSAKTWQKLYPYAPLPEEDQNGNGILDPWEMAQPTG